MFSGVSFAGSIGALSAALPVASEETTKHRQPQMFFHREICCGRPAQTRQRPGAGGKRATHHYHHSHQMSAVF